MKALPLSTCNVTFADIHTNILSNRSYLSATSHSTNYSLPLRSPISTARTTGHSIYPKDRSQSAKKQLTRTIFVPYGHFKVSKISQTKPLYFKPKNRNRQTNCKDSLTDINNQMLNNMNTQSFTRGNFFPRRGIRNSRQKKLQSPAIEIVSKSISIGKFGTEREREGFRRESLGSANPEMDARKLKSRRMQSTT